MLKPSSAAHDAPFAPVTVRDVCAAMLFYLLGGGRFRDGSMSDRLNVFSVIDLETLVLYPLYC